MRGERAAIAALLFDGLKSRLRATKTAWRLSRARGQLRVWLFNLQDRLLQCVVSERGTARSTTPFVLVRIAVWSGLSFLVLALLVPLALTRLSHLSLALPLDRLIHLMALPVDDPAVGFGVFAAIAGITGVLLGLYFSAYSAAIAQLFDRLPSPVQRAINEEGAGLRYAERLAVLTSTMLILGVWVAAQHPLPMATYASSALATMVVLGAGLVMARRTANIFDMGQLAGLIGHEIVRAASRCTLDHPRSHDPSWQNHQRLRASEYLRRLRALVHTVLEQSAVEPSDLQQVANMLARTAIVLQHCSGAIPPGSQWHHVKHRQVWPYSADAFRRHVGLTLGQTAGTQVETDRSWVERELLELLTEMILAAIRKDALGRAASLTRTYSDVIQQLAERGRWRLISDAVRRLYEGLSETGGTLKLTGQDALMLADALLNLELARVVGLLRRAEVESEPLSDNLRQHAWGQPDGRRFRSAGPAYTEALWDLHQWASRERSIEGTVETDSSYFGRRLLAWSVEDIASALAEWLQGVNDRVAQYRSVFRGVADARIEILACWHARGIGGRLEHLIDHLEQNLPPPELDPNIDLARQRQQLADTRESARRWLAAMAQSEAKALGSLLELEPGEHEPFWFAETVQHLAGDCVQALRTGRDDLLAEVFPSYFGGAFAAVWLAGAPSPVPEMKALMLKWRPLVELLEISGLAYIYAALTNNPTMWQIVCASWNGWLAKDAQQKLDQLEGLYGIYATPDGVIGEGQVLFNWRRDALIEAARLPRRVKSSRHGLGVDYEFDHPDPEVARLGRESVLPDLKGRKVFARRYLRRRCDSGARRYVKR